MSEPESEPSVPRKIIRTVTPSYRNRPDTEMTTIGWAYFLGLLILLVPLLPFITIVWALGRVLDWFSPD